MTQAPTTIQLRRGTAAQAAANNATLAAGEIGVETDTGKFKIGDGSTPWNSLPYATDLSRLPASVVSIEGPKTGDYPQWNGSTWAPGNPGVNNDGLVGATLADLASVTGANTNYPQTSGVLVMTACRVNAVATRIAFEVDSPGTNLTGPNLIGVYDTGGNLVMSTGDLTSIWSSGPQYNVVVVALPQTLQAGFYHVGVVMSYGPSGTSPYLTGTRVPMVWEIGTQFAAVPRVCYSPGSYPALPAKVRWVADGFTANRWDFVTFIGFLP